MYRLKTNTFRKSANCPSSEKLWAFQNKETPAREHDKIKVHLRFCEFCAAEAEMYARFPLAEESVEKAEIPGPLLQLAEALLAKRTDAALDHWLEEAEFEY
jgi:hypothetical protein